MVTLSDQEVGFRALGPHRSTTHSWQSKSNHGIVFQNPDWSKGGTFQDLILNHREAHCTQSS